mmetsp:Transcript_15582/g.14912  ORF Transcript_15582/g.14912 Transcript_15582/m.14912 type:complete len:419 (-) Transcript_15582:98-1354(-)
MTYLYLLLVSLCIIFTIISILCLIVIVRFYLFDGASKVDRCCLYVGKVSHARLKGGAMHQFTYPLFFSFIDLEQISRIGWLLWPIFKLNGGSNSFCSLDEKDHLKDFVKEEDNVSSDLGKSTSEMNNLSSSSTGLNNKVLSFINNRTKGVKKLTPGGSIRLLTHLTYFGYNFNPISIIYCLRPDKEKNEKIENEKNEKIENEQISNDISVNLKENQDITNSTKIVDNSLIDSIVVEVSNTPWIEMHTYMLDESVENVDIIRGVKQRGEVGAFQASWLKSFHVSPFMEMDYKYNFTFSEPKESVWVKSTMTKLSTSEVWFTVNFELRKLPFTPLNLLYVLLFYPFYTRVIQVLIHYEAIRLFLKGIPTFGHPKGTPVEFGFGLTDKNLTVFIDITTKKIQKIYRSIFGGVESVSSKKKD